MFTVYISLEFLCNYQAHCSSAYVDTAQIVHCNVLAEKNVSHPKLIVIFQFFQVFLL